MNDFTKEELGIIYCNLCINPKTKDILIKIQSMIDNYSDEYVNPDCYCGQISWDKTIITDCGYPPHKKAKHE